MSTDEGNSSGSVSVHDRRERDHHSKGYCETQSIKIEREVSKVVEF